MQRIERIPIATLALGALLFCGCSPRDATSFASPEEAAGALADLSLEQGSLDRALDRATDSAWNAARAPLTLELGREPSDVEQEWVREMLRETLADYLTREVWNEVVTQVYGARFSAAELDQLVEFYRSPVGRKSLSLAGEVIREADVVMSERLDTRIEEFITRVDARLAERFDELGGGS